MDRPALLKRLDDERQNLTQGGAIHERTDSLTRICSPYRAVVFSSLTADTADPSIAAEIDHHQKLGMGFEWKLYEHDKPADMLARLARHGFQIGPREAVLVLDLSAPADWIDGTGPHSVVRVDGPEQVEIYRRVAEAVFSKDYEFTTRELMQAVQAGSTYVRGYIAFAGEQAVSIGRLYTHPGSIFGGLYGGGTRAESRGRGFYRALVAARARDAIAAGARYLIVDALPTSQPILQRLGFEWLTHTWPCDWQPCTKPVEAR